MTANGACSMVTVTLLVTKRKIQLEVAVARRIWVEPWDGDPGPDGTHGQAARPRFDL